MATTDQQNSQAREPLGFAPRTWENTLRLSFLRQKETQTRWCKFSLLALSFQFIWQNRLFPVWPSCSTQFRHKRDCSSAQKSNLTRKYSKLVLLKYNFDLCFFYVFHISSFYNLSCALSFLCFKETFERKTLFLSLHLRRTKARRMFSYPSL